eukprot:786235-Pelagomonas_calceolata.AAC.2
MRRLLEEVKGIEIPLIVCMLLMIAGGVQDRQRGCTHRGILQGQQTTARSLGGEGSLLEHNAQLSTGELGGEASSEGDSRPFEPVSPFPMT